MITSTPAQRVLPARTVVTGTTKMGRVTADEVRLDETEHRYEITEDGAVAGFVTYHDRDGVRSLLHTEIDPAYEGRGLASRLIEAALDDLRERGLRLRPVCPFVRAFLDKRPEYVELVPAEERDRFGLGPAAADGASG